MNVHDSDEFYDGFTLPFVSGAQCGCPVCRFVRREVEHYDYVDNRFGEELDAIFLPEQIIYENVGVN